MYLTKTEEYLDAILESIQVSQSRYESAARTYKSFCEWFSREKSTVRPLAPDSFLQGSFRLGTAIRPTTEEDEYDLDIVVSVNGSKATISQSDLKAAVGAEVKSYAKAQVMSRPVNARRCWTQNYADGSRFHVDILPAIPDAEGLRSILEERELSTDFVQDAIAITDKTSVNYEQIHPLWPVSNPRGYATWFEGQMGGVLAARKAAIALMESRSVDDIPTYRAQTPLQKAVQVLKFHRDVMFADDPDDKPISVIITTLAAQSYKGEATVALALNRALSDMDTYIEQRNGIDWVANPTILSENFADKWVEYPNRRKNFYEWLDRAREDFLRISQASGRERESIIAEAFGDGVASRAFNDDGYLRTWQKRASIFASHRESPPWALSNQGRVWIKKATWSTPGTYRTRPFSSDSKAIPKQKTLRFYGETNVPKPYEVHWQIVNTGEEAERANCPRGGFEVGAITSGKIMRKETTAYRGSHTVEAFVVKDGYLAARSGQFIVNIE